MGYSYDVALLIKASAKDKLWTAIGIAGDEISDLLSVKGYDSKQLDTDTGDLLYYWSFCKLSLEEQEFFDELYSLLNESDFHLIKLGENWTDIESRGCHYNNSFNLKLIREIKFNSGELVS